MAKSKKKSNISISEPVKEINNIDEALSVIESVIEDSLKPDIDADIDEIMEEHQELMMELDKIEEAQKTLNFSIGSHSLSDEEFERFEAAVERFLKPSGIRHRKGSLTQETINIYLCDPAFCGHIGSLRRYLSN